MEHATLAERIEGMREGIQECEAELQERREKLAALEQLQRQQAQVTTLPDLTRPRDVPRTLKRNPL